MVGGEGNIQNAKVSEDTYFLPPRVGEKSIVNALLTPSLRTPEFVKRVHDMAWHDGRKSREVSAQYLAKHLQVFEGKTIRNVLYEDLGYKSNVLNRGQFRALKSMQMQMPMSTLQTIVVKPSWIDSVANGGRPPLSSNRNPYHPIKLSQLRIGCHTKFMAVS
ncbi:hypothetical protein ACTXT7_002259 [Hymenolepis weldensis]